MFPVIRLETQMTKKTPHFLSLCVPYKHCSDLLCLKKSRGFDSFVWQDVVFTWKIPIMSVSYLGILLLPLVFVSVQAWKTSFCNHTPERNNTHTRFAVQSTFCPCLESIIQICLIRPQLIKQIQPILAWQFRLLSYHLISHTCSEWSVRICHSVNQIFHSSVAAKAGDLDVL